MSAVLLNSYMPARVICGEGCVLKNAGVFASFGRACLIVTSSSAAKKSGALADCKKALEKAGVRYTLFDGVEPNPQTTGSASSRKTPSSPA